MGYFFALVLCMEEYEDLLIPIVELLFFFIIVINLINFLVFTFLNLQLFNNVGNIK
jgi:hypothetical protein